MEPSFGEAFINGALARLIEEEQVDGAQVLEAVGVFGLFRDAVSPGAPLSPTIERAAAVLQQRILATYPHTPQTASQVIHRHMQQAFRSNPALILLKQMLENEINTAAQADSAKARRAQQFLNALAAAQLPIPAAPQAQPRVRPIAKKTPPPPFEN